MSQLEKPSFNVLLPAHAWLNKALVWLSRITKTGIPSPVSASRPFMKQKSALTIGTLGDSPVTSACFLRSALAYEQCGHHGA